MVPEQRRRVSRSGKRERVRMEGLWVAHKLCDVKYNLILYASRTLGSGVQPFRVGVSAYATPDSAGS